MKRLTLTIQIAVCLIFLIAANSTGKEIDYKEMSEDIEIMSRIFDKKLKGEFEDEYRTGRFRYFLGDSDTLFTRLAKCRGTYLPDFGVIFTTDVEFPVAKIEQEEQKTEAEEPSLWKQMEAEIKNQSTTQRKVVVAGKSKPYEKEKVEELKELILSTISEYAPNIAQLNPDDRIAIVVYGNYSVESRDIFGNALLQYNTLSLGQADDLTKAQIAISRNEHDELKKAEDELKKAEIVAKVAEVDRKLAKNEVDKLEKERLKIEAKAAEVDRKIAKAEVESKIAKEVDKLEKETDKLTDKTQDQKLNIPPPAVVESAPTLPKSAKTAAPPFVYRPQISKSIGYSSRYTDLPSDQCGTVLVISVARKYIEDEEQLKRHATILQY